ncbi:P-loop containing nucleoside triphosphate hydrolase protein [Kickxella alabastrina]|uniref:P-loop containing nucleoside triphosphate hydrolase protein n=1 Tax=Kickxella alabastrina TaxID=61397 RepID=UPI00221EF382|nr:P-loop containing nucleoside triphosphate hydrolase protein [Kickxella alabastrina]KAI7823937.1 P-loop containing nucleoside triphosphate hydrolase protein [Kickxella alabastrina]
MISRTVISRACNSRHLLCSQTQQLCQRTATQPTIRSIQTSAVTSAILGKIQQALASARPGYKPLANTGGAMDNVMDQLQDTRPRTPDTRKQQHKRPGDRRRREQPNTVGTSEHGAYRPADPMMAMPKVFGPIEQPADAQIAKFVIFGAANAGKSTLVNRLTGANVSIVSARPQTTRTRIMASSTVGSKQLVFLDTPGVVSRQALRRVARTVVTSPWLTLGEADFVILLLDAYKLTQKTDEVEKYLFAQLKSNSTVPAILVVNKIDTVEDQEKLTEKVREYVDKYPHIVAGPLFISALGNVNVDELRAILLERTRPGDWVVPAHVSCDMSDLMRAEELIRAEWFARLSGHLPYVVRQRNAAWEYVDTPLRQTTYSRGNAGAAEDAEPSVRVVTRTQRVLVIKQELVVSTGGEAKILLGAGGQNIKDICREANANIVAAMGHPVRLHLQVVVEVDTTHRK